jgi:hypothetical protein
MHDALHGTAFGTQYVTSLATNYQRASTISDNKKTKILIIILTTIMLN